MERGPHGQAVFSLWSRRREDCYPKFKHFFFFPFYKNKVWLSSMQAIPYVLSESAQYSSLAEKKVAAFPCLVRILVMNTYHYFVSQWSSKIRILVMLYLNWIELNREYEREKECFMQATTFWLLTRRQGKKQTLKRTISGLLLHSDGPDRNQEQHRETEREREKTHLSQSVATSTRKRAAV